MNEEAAWAPGVLTHRQVMGSAALTPRVRRYHTWPVIHQQTVGEHSCRIVQIYIGLFGLPRAEVLAHVAHHDAGEFFAGDNPFYAKRAVPALKTASDEAERVGLENVGAPQYSLTILEWETFKICDLLEMFEFGLIEERMGNQYGRRVADNIATGLEAMVGRTRAAEYLLWIAARL